MIRAFRFLWEQLNGPQITSIMDAIFEYMKSQFDKWLDYWYTLSIQTAREEHLLTFGILRGIARPNVMIKNENYFLYTELPPDYYVDAEGKGHGREGGYERGFDPLDTKEKPLGIGGKFYTNVNVKGSVQPLPLGYYRILLMAALSGVGESNSMRLLDKIIYDMCTYDLKHNMTGRYYRIENEMQTITVHVGGQTTWSNPPAFQAAIEALNGTLFGPTPVIKISYDQ